MKNKFANDIKKIVGKYIYYKYIYLSSDPQNLLMLIRSEYETKNKYIDSYTNYERTGTIFENLYLPLLHYFYKNNNQEKVISLANLINNNFFDNNHILNFVIDWENIFTFSLKNSNIRVIDYLSDDLKKSIINSIKFRSTNIILDFEKEIILNYHK